VCGCVGVCLPRRLSGGVWVSEAGIEELIQGSLESEGRRKLQTGMTLMIELCPETEQRLRAEAACAGQTPQEFVRMLLEERLGMMRERQIQRNQAAIALLQQWRQEPPDPEGKEGYPEQIEPLRFR